jgi:hypothetical protein
MSCPSIIIHDIRQVTYIASLHWCRVKNTWTYIIPFKPCYLAHDIYITSAAHTKLSNSLKQIIPWSSYLTRSTRFCIVMQTSIPDGYRWQHKQARHCYSRFWLYKRRWDEATLYCCWSKREAGRKYRQSLSNSRYQRKRVSDIIWSGMNLIGVCCGVLGFSYVDNCLNIKFKESISSQSLPWLQRVNSMEWLVMWWATHPLHQTISGAVVSCVKRFCYSIWARDSVCMLTRGNSELPCRTNSTSTRDFNVGHVVNTAEKERTMS